MDMVLINLFLFLLFLLWLIFSLGPFSWWAGVCQDTGLWPSHDNEIGWRACTTTWKYTLELYFLLLWERMMTAL